MEKEEEGMEDEAGVEKVPCYENPRLYHHCLVVYYYLVDQQLSSCVVNVVIAQGMQNDVPNGELLEV